MTITITEATSAKYSNADHTQIDCIITCEKGVFPYTARADDPMDYGRELFGDLEAGKYGDIAAFTD